MLGLMSLVKDVLDKYGETTKSAYKNVDVSAYEMGSQPLEFITGGKVKVEALGVMKEADRIHEIS